MKSVSLFPSVFGYGRRPGAKAFGRSRRCTTARAFCPEALEPRIVLSSAQVDLPYTEFGELHGAEYEIGVPENWNGTLLVVGRGGGEDVDHPSEFPNAEFADDPIPLVFPHFQVLLQQGYAIASTGYSEFGMEIEPAIKDVTRLRSYFNEHIAEADVQIFVGPSLGAWVGQHLSENGSAGFDGVVNLSGFGAGTQNLADRMLVTRLAYDVLFADQGGFLPEWGTVDDVRDEFDRANEVYPLDFETEVLPVMLPQFFDLDPETGDPTGYNADNFGKWEFMRILLGQSESGLNQFFGTLPNGVGIPSYPFIPMFQATEWAQAIERRAGGAPAQNLDHLYTMAQEDIDYLATLGVDADQLLSEMNDRRIYGAKDKGARQYLGKFGTSTGKLKIPMIAEHHANDVNLIVQSRDYFTQLVENAGRSENLVQLYVAPGGGHLGDAPQHLQTVVTAMDGWIRTGVKPDRTDDAIFPAELGYDANFEPGPYPFVVQPGGGHAAPQPIGAASSEMSVMSEDGPSSTGAAASSWTFVRPGVTTATNTNSDAIAPPTVSSRQVSSIHQIPQRSSVSIGRQTDIVWPEWTGLETTLNYSVLVSSIDSGSDSVSRGTSIHKPARTEQASRNSGIAATRNDSDRNHDVDELSYAALDWSFASSSLLADLMAIGI